MKIQIVLPQHQELTQQFQDCKIVSIQELNNIPAASCSLINIGNICDFIQNREQALVSIISKLKYDGELIIEGTDLLSIAYDIIEGSIQLSDLQNLLFAGRFMCLTFDQVRTELRNLGLQLIHSRSMQYRYSIRAKRPNVQQTN